MVASSGSPFNITSPNDLNGDSVFNDRPGLLTRATCSTVVPPPSSNVYCTPLGTFDARPDLASIPEGALPINYGTGPAHFALNLRLTKTFGFGPKAPNKATPSGGAIEGGRAGGGGGGHGHGPLFGGGAMGGMPSASDECTSGRTILQRFSESARRLAGDFRFLIPSCQRCCGVFVPNIEVQPVSHRATSFTSRPCQTRVMGCKH